MADRGGLRKTVSAEAALSGILLIWIVGAIYFVQLLQCLKATDRHFTYALDDPYIHLAMARNFALHGVWGVTPYASASASSSPLWVLVLALAVRVVGDRVELPLILGLAASFATAFVLYRQFLKAGLRASLAALGVVAVVLIGPLHVLPFTGMEHSLQILLDLLFGFWLLDAMSRSVERRDLKFGFAFSLLMCLCRYESVFLLCVPFAICLFRREWKLAACLAAGPVLAIGGFGLISLMEGMPFIPNSILLKGNASHGSLGDFLSRLPNRTYNNLHYASFAMWDLFVIEVAAALVFRFSSLRESTKGLQVYIWTVVAAAVLHSGFATVGIFYRYESYLIVLLATAVILSAPPLYSLKWRSSEAVIANWTWIAGIVGVCLLQGALYFAFWFYGLNMNLLIFLYAIGLALLFAMSRPPLTQGKFYRVALACCIPGVLLVMVHDRGKAGFDDGAKASADIYLQQYQMSRFLGASYPSGKLACNDIGAVTYFTQIHLLDLVGLASDSIRKIRLNHQFTTETAAAELRTFDPDVIIVYPDWFTGKESLPSSLIPVGEWTIPPVTSAGSRMVTFYATSVPKALALKRHLLDFQRELPAAVVCDYERINLGAKERTAAPAPTIR